jgi:uncharacterized membrane protein
MVGLMQIMIYLLCVYLMYKGVEIFQIAFVSSSTNKQIKNVGMVIGIIAIAVSIAVAIGTILITESMVAQIGNNMQNLGR